MAASAVTLVHSCLAEMIVAAERDRAYQYHLSCVLQAETPGDLTKYLAILSLLQHDPENKHPVSVGSLLVRRLEAPHSHVCSLLLAGCWLPLRLGGL